MSKDTKKRIRHDRRVIESLMKLYDCSERFVYLSISDERTSEMALKIKKDYLKICKARENILP